MRDIVSIFRLSHLILLALVPHSIKEYIILLLVWTGTRAKLIVQEYLILVQCLIEVPVDLDAVDAHADFLLLITLNSCISLLATIFAEDLATQAAMVFSECPSELPKTLGALVLVLVGHPLPLPLLKRLHSYYYYNNFPI